MQASSQPGISVPPAFSTRRKAILCLVAFAFLLRLGLCFTGYDRRPFMTSNDEAVVLDPAVSLAWGEGLRAPSLEGLDLANRFYHYPPLSFFVQGGIFRVCGVSAATMRIPSIVEHLLGLLVLFWILRQGCRSGLMDAFAAWIAAALILADPFLLILSRIGRMEHLGALLGLGGIAFALGARLPGGGIRFRKFLAGAVLIGLALATHPSAVLYQIFFYALAALAWNELGWTRRLCLFSMPGVAFLAVWGVGFGAASLEALRQMQALAGFNLKPSLGWELLQSAVAHRNFEDFKQLGATAYLLVVGGWMLLCIRPLAGRGNAPEAWRKGSRIFAVAALLQMAAAWKMNLYVSRTMLYAPLAAVHIAIGLSFLPKTGRRIAAAATTLFVCIGVAATAGYFLQLAKNWNAWSADRFAPLVSSFPKEAKVASTFELWHEWMKQHRPVRMIDPSLPIDHLYWLEDPLRFSRFDGVIFSSRTGGLRQSALKAGAFPASEWSEESFARDDAVYFVYRKLAPK